MELFDKKFVHFMWDDELEGKKCFVADSIDILKLGVEQAWCRMCFEVTKGEADYPFAMQGADSSSSAIYRFAYYDPNYSIKKAFNEGKTIQLQISESCWKDISSYPDLLFVCNTHGILRIKPEEKWIAYLSGGGYLTACKEDAWEMAQEDCGAKTQLFVGSKDEAIEWYKSRQKFAKVIKAWEDGKTIQYYNKYESRWELSATPTWDADNYRVKPECPCEDGIDSKACVGCEHSEDGKPEYKPYESISEFVQDFQERFRIKYNPSWSMPMIWLWDKELDKKCLVRDFESDKVMCGSTSWTMEELFDRWTYLDGSPVGRRNEKIS